MRKYRNPREQMIHGKPFPIFKIMVILIIIQFIILALYTLEA